MPVLRLSSDCIKTRFKLCIPLFWKLAVLLAGHGGVDEDDESYSFADLGGRSAAFAGSAAATSGLASEGSTFEVSCCIYPRQQSAMQ